MSGTHILRYEDGEVREYEKGREPRPGVSFAGSPWGKGQICNALRCHSSQVPEFRKDLEQSRIPGVDILDNGAVKFESRKARREYMRHRGVFDKDAGYKDAAPINF